jgi:nitrogenase-associated protein
MAQVIFYEKPGCAGNARQKALLRASGHLVVARNLMTEPWSVSSLRPYFGTKPIKDWFNQASPRVKSGEIDIGDLTPERALIMMIADPTLIRRPLMRVDESCEAGFDQQRVSAWIGLSPADQTISDVCVRTESDSKTPM